MKYLTTLTGPSCAGKSTLERMLADRGAQRVISTTTRPPRGAEKNGEDYYFVSDGEFHKIKSSAGFVECVKFGDYWYGVTVDELERLYVKGEHIVLVCEPVGATQIKEYCSLREDIKLTRVFVDNPFDVINDRFLTRFYEDMRTAMMLRQGDPRQIIARYAKRLTVMQTVEQGWRDEQGDYDIYLQEFNEYTAKATAITLSDPSRL